MSEPTGQTNGTPVVPDWGSVESGVLANMHGDDDAAPAAPAPEAPAATDTAPASVAPSGGEPTPQAAAPAGGEPTPQAPASGAAIPNAQTPVGGIPQPTAPSVPQQMDMAQVQSFLAQHGLTIGQNGQPVPIQPQAPQIAPEQMQQQLRAAAAQNLAKRYALDAETGARLIAEPENIIPGALANMHLAIVEDVARLFQQQLPSMMREVGQRDRQSESAENGFFEKWPKLREHKQDVLRTLTVYRQQFPQAPMEQAVAEVGAMVMFQKGLQGDTPKPPMPAAKPFMPAQAGGTVSRQQAQAQPNVWADLARQYEESGM